MNTYTCVIVDDDSHALSRLAEFIAQTASLTLISTYNHALTAVREIVKGPDIDFLFLDVEMPGLSGFEVMQQIGFKSRFRIFVSAHLSRTIEAFDADATHFILKPFSLRKFQETVQNILDRPVPEKKEQPYILIKCNPNTQVIKLFADQIIMIEGASNYVKVHTIDKTYITYARLSDMEARLGNSFWRINKSYIISSSHIDKIAHGYIYLDNYIQLKIGTTYKRQVAEYVEAKLKAGSVES